MLRRDSNSSIKHTHHVTFTVENVEVTVDEMGTWVAGMVRNFPSEQVQEEFACDAACAIVRGIAGKVGMAKADAERAKIRREWVKLHPPNHAGFYYCHVGGEWVHKDAADLEHIVPASIERIDLDIPGWDEKLRMACRPHNSWKGSRQDIPSATLEFSPPDEEC